MSKAQLNDNVNNWGIKIALEISHGNIQHAFFQTFCLMELAQMRVVRNNKEEQPHKKQKRKRFKTSRRNRNVKCRNI